VRHCDHRLSSLGRKPQEDVEYDLAVPTVEIAGRLVGKEQNRIIGERARDRDALALSSRELVCILAGIVQAEFGEQRFGAGAHLGVGQQRALSHRHEDIFEHRELGEQEMVLEHEADLGKPQAREAVSSSA
jgi:hypothetical protein